jgi:hypothetical protein
MENIELYKEFYFFEINRKYELNNSVNIPVLILSTIVSIHFYLFSQTMDCYILLIGKLLSSITVVGMVYSIYYLISSFSNFFNNHSYRELADMKSVYDYEIKNRDNENEFNNYLKVEFANCASHNFIINKRRIEDIAKSKKGIFISIISTFLFSIIYIISNL